VRGGLPLDDRGQVQYRKLKRHVVLMCGGA
jgi:hypothetical protein